jgi:DNA (cytosine-5)-methyltransferase 1
VVGSSGKTLPAKPEGTYSSPRGEEYDRYAPRPIGLGHAIFDLPPREADAGTSVANWDGESYDEKRARRFLSKYDMRTSPRILFNHTVRYHNDRDLELYSLLAQGEDGMHIVERGRRDLMRYRTDAFDDKYMRLDERAPCKTIVAHLAKDGNGYVHPTQTRSISLREAARIQTFHDGYAFCGSSGDQWVQLGNAVPPVLGEVIGRSLKSYLDRGIR